jgi:hypothetical protein
MVSVTPSAVYVKLSETLVGGFRVKVGVPVYLYCAVSAFFDAVACHLIAPVEPHIRQVKVVPLTDI